MTPEIVDYIQKCRSNGLADEIILSNLRAAGWDENNINESFASLKEDLPGYAATPARTKSRKKLLVIAAAIAATLILAGAGYAIYSKSASSPEKVWVKALANAAAQKSGNMKFAIAYRETLPEGDDPANEASFAGDLILRATGASRFQKSNEALDSEIKSEISAKLEDFEFAFTVESRKIGDGYFYKIGGNPLAALSEGLGEAVYSTSGQWYRQNLAVNSETQSTLKTLDQIQLFLKNADILQLEKYLGIEKIDGQGSAHFQASINRERLTKYLENTSLAKIAEKLDFHKIEVWIGHQDNRIRQMILETNFPGFVGGFREAEEENEPRDVQRLSDVLQLASALEQYKTANSRYPAAANGLPELPGVSVPFAPKPADGGCTAEQNLYWYEPSADALNYQLRFCLGSDTEGYQAGVLTATENGISPGASESLMTEGKNKLENLPFNATIELKLNFSAYNEHQNITEPAGAIEPPEPLKADDTNLEDIFPEEE